MIPAPEPDDILAFLLDAPMFAGLDPHELAGVVRILQVESIGAGDRVFSEGERGDAWYVVFAGEVEVVKQDLLDGQVLARLGPRQCFGEMAILDGGPRSAAVRAATDGVLFRFPRAAFAGLLQSGNLAAYKLVHQIARVLVARQRDVTAQMVGLIRGKADADAATLGPLVGRSAASE